jgi:aminoglycoside phosphotransferase family enzyme
VVTAAAPPSLAAKVEFLARPAAYPERPAQVEAVETHMSWVFLADGWVYKLKKPVRYDFLDFSTLAARRRCCEEEVRLNRRLAPEVYLGTVVLALGPRGELGLDGAGEVVDWLVKMRRLPAARSLPAVVAGGALRSADLTALGSRLADFYRRCPPADLAPADYLRRQRADVEANRRELAAPGSGLPPALVGGLAAAQVVFLERHAELVGDRVRAGRVVEGHGDLRPEHVFLLETGPVVIDCIEFNREFRMVDWADELAYLGMECARLGARAAGERVLDVCAEALGDRPAAELLRFYAGRRACLRAKICLWHSADPGVADPEGWRRRAREYLELAESCVPAAKAD